MEYFIQECQIFAPTSVYSHYPALQYITIEKYEHYQKRTSRNRYLILTANGPLTLSIPLTKGKNNHQLIYDVKISYEEDWVKKHLNAIKSAYGKSPYMEFYFPEIEKLFFKKVPFLFDLNTISLELMLKFLGMNLLIDYSSTYQNSSLDNKDTSIKKHHDNITFINYPQVWQEKFNFTPNLSIIDLLFCTGPEALTILKRMKSLS